MEVQLYKVVPARDKQAVAGDVVLYVVVNDVLVLFVLIISYGGVKQEKSAKLLKKYAAM